MIADWISRLCRINVGHWPLKKRITGLFIVFLICAVLMNAVAAVIEAYIRIDGDIDLQRQQNLLLQDTLWQQQGRQLVSKQQQVYLGILETLVGTSQASIKASDITHFVNVLQNAAVFNGWQHLQIGYRELEDAVVLDVQATVMLVSLSPFWLALQDSGNLFDILQLEFKASDRAGLYAVRLQLQPLQAGRLPPSTCLQHCLAPAHRPQKQKGFLLRSGNNSEQLTPLASDSLGRVSAVKQASPGASQ